MSTWVIAMALQMSGGRYDDRQWPPPWTEFEVPDWEGQGLVSGGHAVKVRELAESAPAHVTAPVPVSLPAQTAAGPVDELVQAQDAPQEPDDEAQPPAPSAPKQDWIDYAVSQGASEDEAGQMTKADLMSRYGGRL